MLPKPNKQIQQHQQTHRLISLILYIFVHHPSQHRVTCPASEALRTPQMSSQTQTRGFFGKVMLCCCTNCLPCPASTASIQQPCPSPAEAIQHLQQGEPHIHHAALLCMALLEQSSQGQTSHQQLQPPLSLASREEEMLIEKTMRRKVAPPAVCAAYFTGCSVDHK